MHSHSFASSRHLPGWNDCPATQALARAMDGASQAVAYVCQARRGGVSAGDLTLRDSAGYDRTQPFEALHL